MCSQRFTLGGKVIAEELARIYDGIVAQPDEPAELHIQSTGGNLDAALDFYRAVREKHVPLKTFAYGNASSAAFIVLMTGTERTACRKVKCQLHESSQEIAVPQSLNQDLIQQIGEHLREVDRKFAEIVATESGGTLQVSEVLAMMKEERVLGLDDLLKYKLIHRATI